MDTLIVQISDMPGRQSGRQSCSELLAEMGDPKLFPSAPIQNGEGNSMIDISLELTRAVVIGLTVFVLIRVQRDRAIQSVEGWSLIVIGFVLIFLGTLIDITDNFPGLNHFLIVGDTPIQAFLEKVVGYLLGFMLLFVGIWKWLPKLIEHQKIITQNLQNAEKEVKVLQGLLPICASCKKIRDDEGYWQQIEGFISEHSDATFSHSICPDCVKVLYPETYQGMKSNLAPTNHSDDPENGTADG